MLVNSIWFGSEKICELGPGQVYPRFLPPHEKEFKRSRERDLEKGCHRSKIYLKQYYIVKNKCGQLS